MDDLKDNHRRAISTVLGLLDALLCDFGRWIEEGDVHGVLCHRTNRLTVGQVRTVREQAAGIRRTMDRLRTDLRLDDRQEDVGTMVWSRAMSFLETLTELQSRHLRSYGEVPPDLANYLDPRVRALSDRLHKLAEGVSDRPSDSIE